MMAGKENSAMTILMDFAKPCKGKLIGSVILAVLGDDEVYPAAY